MARWRWAVAVFLAVAVGLPLALPFLDLLRRPAAWRSWGEADRLLLLARNTLLLAAGTVLVSVPAGVAAAVLLYRTDLPLRAPIRGALVLTLFVPLPLVASGWQAVFGAGGWLPAGWWSAPLPLSGPSDAGGALWAPWGQGLAALWIHSCAAVPWVVLLVGHALGWVEREVEEDALLAAGRWRVLCRVTLARSRAAVGAAALWVALLTATEITVTDMMQVRTFAEEVYTQFVRPDIDPAAGDARDMIARAVAVSVPGVLLTAALVWWAGRRWERSLPPLTSYLGEAPVFPLGWVRWPACGLLLLATAVLIGVPVASLVRKAGLTGVPPAWSGAAVVQQLRLVLKLRADLVAESLAYGLVGGAAVAAVGLVTCWLAASSRRFRAAALVLVAVVWAVPGPVIGIGLNRAIALVLDVTASPALAKALYYGPSPAPLFWVYLIRFLPFGVALLWPVVRLLPRDLTDSAAVDGAGPGRRLAHVVLPLTWPACVRAGLAVAVLSLGELSAGKLVETPGSQTFAHEVFVQMHYGVTNQLAALCLVLLAAVAGGGALVLAAGRLLRGRAGGRRITSLLP